MQVPTSAFYDRSAKAMGALSVRADQLNTQIATTRKLQLPSDNAAAFQRLQTLKRDTSNDVAYGANLDMAASLLASADTTLSAITSQLQRASELALSAKTGTQNDASRAAIAEELATIVDQLAALGNTRDSRGQPLFGGAEGAAAVSQDADGKYRFAAAPLSAIPVGDGQTIQATETASRIFKLGDGDIITAIADFAAALKAGGDVTAASNSAIDQLGAASDTVNAVQASLGARAARVDLVQAQLTDIGADREAVRSGIEDTDVPSAIAELQKTMTILSATQATFSKLSSLSLFDYLK